MLKILQIPILRKWKIWKKKMFENFLIQVNDLSCQASYTEYFLLNF